MPNEQLRAALLAKGFTTRDLAERIGVDPKTVERWITQDKRPYRRHQYATATILKVDASFLWSDDVRTVASAADLGKAEIVTVYPHRHMVPKGLWQEIYGRAERQLDVLVYAGGFLAEDPVFHRLISDKAKTAQVRILMGDPDCPAVRQRGTDEGHMIMGPKIRNALVNYRPLMDSHPEIEFRLHDATLYNSIYRADNEMLVNTHVYGIGAYLAPVLHLRKLSGASLFDTYAESIDHTWAKARPVRDSDFPKAE
ncbi:helix-turn-helix transcriptional regulator [Streptomyces sp. DSM 44915]|uniref:Helix-turn-helix transcriptional regulator n=1 Tax=Streptomyces chisholmiae TaxID=3075540 RepID=A0ABU2JZ73_9ACTN|nr:helix-turn-helix transcriptional regulator [Streptomyces sp. DSM 44915]MDT0270039.1 helix-turn-helix transcriptional regulator [Streptomyces sp. DSM 44915]